LEFSEFILYIPNAKVQLALENNESAISETRNQLIKKPQTDFMEVRHYGFEKYKLSPFVKIRNKILRHGFRGTKKIISYTVDIFSGEPGKFTQLRFTLKNFGRISSDLGEFRPLFSQRICEKSSPEIFEVKLNCADSPISGEKNNNCVLHTLKLYPHFDLSLRKLIIFFTFKKRFQSLF
jgi:hypothetical protein